MIASASATLCSTASAGLFSPKMTRLEPLVLPPEPHSASAPALVLRPPPRPKSIDHPWPVTTAPALPASLVLRRLADSPTLLPANVAKLISTISLVARVSLRASGFLLECLVEALQFSTKNVLGISRRMLITAVGSARTLQYVNAQLDWNGRHDDGQRTSDRFLHALDEYTNLGIYLVHHTFSLAELFAMSGFYLTAAAVSTGFGAAEESVRMLESILGSNETSRALASIISLVRKELAQDASLPPAERGAVAGLTTLTKTLTAFICLQSATHKRTLKEMKLRVVYDCTIVVEGDAVEVSRDSNGRYAPPPLATASAPPPSILTDLHAEIEHQASRPSSLYSGLNGSGSPRTQRSRTTSIVPEDELEASGAELVEDLKELCGVEEASSSEDDDELPDEVRQALLEVQTQGGNATIDVGFDYEIEVEETTTTTTTTLRARDGTILKQPVLTPSRAGLAKGEINSSIENVDSNGHSAGRAFIHSAVNDDEWVELSTMFDRGERKVDDESGLFDHLNEIPAARNGTTSIANLSRQDTLDHPDESRQRLQVVLETITKKFTQKKRTVRRVGHDSTNTTLFPPRVSALTGGSTSSSRDRAGRGGKWSQSSSAAQSSDALYDGANSSGASTPRKGKGVLKSIQNALKKSPSSENSPTRLLRPKRSTSSTSSLEGSGPSSPPDSPELAHKLAYAVDPSPLIPAPPPTLPRFSAEPGAKLHSSSRAGPSKRVPGPPQASSSNANSKRASVPPHLRRTPSIKSIQSVRTMCTHTAATSTEEAEPKASNFPRQHLVSNLDHFMRYSSAAYGQAFLRILGMGRHEFNFPTTSPSHHANVHAFAHHVGIKVDDVLLSSHSDPTADAPFSSKMSPLVNFVAVDHNLKAVVLSCRGSLGLSDILVDLTCDYEPIAVQHGDPDGVYSVHSGMWASATLLQRGTVHDTIADALSAYKDYGLVLCGHSLGGGVAALLSILWASPAETFAREAAARRLSAGHRVSHPSVTTQFVTGFDSGLPPGRPISCFTYGVPCVASADLARYCEGLVWSTVHNLDIVPTLSLGVLRDLKNMAMGLASEVGTAEEIVGRVIGLHQRKFLNRRAASGSSLGASTASAAVGNDTYDTPGSGLMEITDEAKEVPLSSVEVEAGRSANKALDPSYRDPSLLGAEASEDVELNDWLYSLVKTIRAANDNDKLYPPGLVYVIEAYTVFISSESATGRFTRREGKRILLRAVDDVTARFSEPIFGKSMASDHSPTGYESALNDLFRATVG